MSLRIDVYLKAHNTLVFYSTAKQQHNNCSKFSRRHLTYVLLPLEPYIFHTDSFFLLIVWPIT